MSLLPVNAAADEIVAGTVIDSTSRWTSDGGRIVTDSVIARADGTTVNVSQLGGSADGYGMLVVHGPPVLRIGDRVEALVRRGARTRSIIELVDLDTGTQRFVVGASEEGKPLRWSSGCVIIDFSEEGTTHIDGSDEIAVMNAVFDVWQNQAQSCSYLTFETAASGSETAKFDGKNVIKFYEDEWCRPATDDDDKRCYSNTAAALTVLTFVDDADSDRDGEIVDADIELNAFNFAYAHNGMTNGNQMCRADLANTFTHEVGHLMGLDHTCYEDIGPRPLDGNGNPIPRCAEMLPSEVEEATMYNFQDCGETKKSTPEADDIAGMCFLYPTASDPDECESADIGGGGCCSLGTGGTPPVGSIALAVLVALALIRRRR
jgi:MYXO-CTERM domain-containing protein